jgi:hypothetical protein
VFNANLDTRRGFIRSGFDPVPLLSATPQHSHGTLLNPKALSLKYSMSSTL